MNEYEVELQPGITTTMQLSDEDAKRYEGAKKRGKVEPREHVAPEPPEVAADVERPTPRKSRGSGKETR